MTDMAHVPGSETETAGIRAVTGAETDVVRLLNPRSIAVIGASNRPGSLAWWPLHLLQQCGFAGQIFPVNPKYRELNGLTCYPAIADVGAPVDVAIIPLNAAATPAAVRECAAAGVGSVVLPTQGLGETGEAGRRQEEQLIQQARAAGMRVVGPNTDGIANLATGAVMSIQPLFEEGIAPGPIAVVAQSGATAASILVRLKREGIGVRLSASVGNEADLRLTDFLSVALQDPEVRMVMSFVEGIRRPRDFYRLAELAAELDKPLALLKVGRSEQGVRRASAHTGALAGSDELYEAIFRKYGVIRVGELSELTAVAKMFLRTPRLRSTGVGIISSSGGQAGAAADKAISEGLQVPALSPVTEAAVDDLLTFGAGFNPCDLTGEIATKPELAAQVYREFGKNDSVAAVIYIRKKLLGDISMRSAGPVVEASKEPGAAPLAVYAMDGFVTGPEEKIYAEADVPVFDSLHDLYAAVRALGERTVSLTRLASRLPSAAPSAGQVPAQALPAGSGVDEETTKRLLARYQLPVPAEIVAPDIEAAVAAAETIGYPVAVKIVSSQIAHKTEIGGVALGLRDAAEVRAAATAILSRGREALGGADPDGLLVQEQVTGGVEVIAGLKIDEEFGPFILLGMGGTTAELLRDISLRPAPVTPDEVLMMIDELRGAALLRGFRGAPPADTTALADAVSKLSQLGADYAGELAEADLNPIAVLPAGSGVRVLDALFVRRA
jgi:acetate---CoA ligase (ADP-forming)